MGDETARMPELALLDLLPQAAVYADAGGAVVHANREAARLFGRVHDLRDLPLAFTPHGERFDEATHPVHRALREGRAVRDARMALLGPEGNVLWLRVHALPRRVRGQAHVLFLAEDVTEAQARLDALADAEEMLRLALDSVSDYAILTLDAAGYVVGLNAAAVKICGGARSFLDRHFRDHLAGPSAEADARAVLEQGAREGKAILQGWLRRPDGAPFWGRATLTALRDEEGAFRGFVTVLEDLTEQRELEQNLRQRNAVLLASRERREAYFRGIAHDLRNPLTPLRLQVQLLRSKAGGGAGRNLDVIERSVDRLARMVTDIADLVLVDHGQMPLERGAFDLAALLREEREAVEAVAHRQGVALELDAPATMSAEGDQALVGRVLANLLSNALKHTPAGGRVTLRARPDAGGARVEVEDTGHGFDAATGQRLFEPFHGGRGADSGAGGGMGLGLLLSKGIVEAHGGTLEAHSPGPGRGAVFAFTLPPAGPPAAQAPERGRTGPDAGPS